MSPSILQKLKKKEKKNLKKIEDDDPDPQPATPSTTQPITQPSSQPSAQPSAQPASQLASQLASQPAAQPSQSVVPSPQPVVPIDLTDLLSGISSSNSTTPSTNPSKITLRAETSGGLQIRSQFVRRSNVVHLEMTLENMSAGTLQNFAIRFNVNVLGISPDGSIKISPIAPGGTGRVSLPLRDSRDAKDLTNQNKDMQMAIKTDLGIAYFSDSLEAYDLFDDNGRLDKKQFLELWKSIDETHEITRELPTNCSSVDMLKQKLAAHNMFFVAQRSVTNKGEVVYFSFQFKGIFSLLEITLHTPATSAKCTVVAKSSNTTFSNLALASLAVLLVS